MTQPNCPISFVQAAGIVRLGLAYSLFERESVIAWADDRIAEMAEPPFWLLSLATSNKLSGYDASALIPKEFSVDPELACGVILSLLPDMTDVATANLRPLVGKLYGIVQSIDMGYRKDAARRDLIWLEDEFDLMENRILANTTMETMRLRIAEFLKKYSLQGAAPALHPIVCLPLI